MVIYEGIFVGILTIIVGISMRMLFTKISGSWQKKYQFEILLFSIGFILHILCEYIGINKWYCKNGNACKR